MTGGTADVLYYAPGAGAGHLVRGCSICIRLCSLGVRCRIVTNSPFARGVSSITGCDIHQIPSELWKSQAHDYALHISPRIIALDSFPWGLRGEWLDRSVPGAQFVYVARRLKTEAYTAMLGAPWNPASPHVSNVIISEPLTAGHSAAIGSASRAITLPGRILLPENVAPPPVPEPLLKLLSRDTTRLVVHSGEWHETRKLLRAASAHARESAGANVVLIAPEPHPKTRTPSFEYFPASRLLPRAHTLFSGAGYNSVAEARAAGIKHAAVPFARKYDDQHGRLDGPAFGTDDGGPAAAQFIFSMLQ